MATNQREKDIIIRRNFNKFFLTYCLRCRRFFHPLLKECPICNKNLKYNFNEEKK